MNKHRQFSFDFLKLVATILIIFHHYQQCFEVQFSTGVNYFDGNFYFGYLVELFFMISGYLSLRYIEEIKREGTTLKSFYLRRYFRFMPMLIVTGVLFEIISYIYKRLLGSFFLNIPISLSGLVISCLGMQEGWVFSSANINNPVWYISVLLLCFLLLYIGVKISKKLNFDHTYFLIFMALIGFGIDLYGINLPFFNATTVRGISPFFIGVLIASFKDCRKNKCINIVSILVAVLSPVLISQFLHLLGNIKYYLVLIFYPSLIIVCKNVHIFETRDNLLTKSIGPIAYNAFMWHLNIFMIVKIINSVFGLNLDFSTRASMYVVTIICLFAGTFSSIMIDVPLSKCIKKVCQDFIS